MREAPTAPPQQPWMEVTTVIQGPLEPRERSHNGTARCPDCLGGSRVASGHQLVMLPWKPGWLLGRALGRHLPLLPLPLASDFVSGSLEPRDC